LYIDIIYRIVLLCVLALLFLTLSRQDQITILDNRYHPKGN